MVINSGTTDGEKTLLELGLLTKTEEELKRNIDYIKAIRIFDKICKERGLKRILNIGYKALYHKQYNSHEIQNEFKSACNAENIDLESLLNCGQ